MKLFGVMFRMSESVDANVADSAGGTDSKAEARSSAVIEQPLPAGAEAPPGTADAGDNPPEPAADGENAGQLRFSSYRIPVNVMSIMPVICYYGTCKYF